MFGGGWRSHLVAVATREAPHVVWTSSMLSTLNAYKIIISIKCITFIMVTVIIMGVGALPPTPRLFWRTGPETKSYKDDKKTFAQACRLGRVRLDKDINGEDIFHQVASHAPAHILKAGGRLGGLMQGCKCGVWGESHQGSRTTKLNKPFRRLTGRSLMGARTTPSLFPFLSSAHSVSLCLLSWTAVKEQFDIENITD